MTRYRVNLHKVTYYEVVVEAEDIEQARVLAHQAHHAGDDTEVDNGDITVYDIRPL